MYTIHGYSHYVIHYIYSTYLCFNWRFVLFNLIFILHWSIIELQCCVSFRCIATWFSYTYIPSFQILFPYKLLQNIELSSLCYTVGPFWLSILHIIMYICSSQPPNLSLSPFFPFSNHKLFSKSVSLSLFCK